MSTIDLSLIISTVNGKDVESVGGVFGLNIEAFNVPGDPWQPIVKGEPAGNSMQIGDELKEAVFRRNFQILRNGDAHSMDLYQAYQAGKRFLVVVAVMVKDGKGATTSTATITINNAKMTKFDRKKRKGFILTTHSDDLRFSFTPDKAKIEYGRDINSIVSAIAGKVLTSIPK